MAYDIEKTEYYHVTVADQSGDGAGLLSRLAETGLDLHAFKAVSLPEGIRFTLFPKDSALIVAEARRSGFVLDGPHSALLIKGREEPGALAGIYRRLARANIRVGDAIGIAGIKDGYGVVLCLAPQDLEAAAVLAT